MAQDAQKLKILHLARIFFERTDDEHGLSTPELIEELTLVGVNVERKALYRDIDALRSFGLDIRTIKGRPVTYALASRAFSFAELSLIVDAVSSSRFLSERKSTELVRAIRGLGSIHQAQRLTGNVHVDRRVNVQRESVYSSVDVIQEALRASRKIEFAYYSVDVEKRRVARRGGKRYLLTPVAIIYSDGFYYLVAYSDKHGDFANYRIDRMGALKISDDAATRNDAIATFDVRAYQSGSFGMFAGERRNVTLLVHESAMNGVIDRFGNDVLVTPGPEAPGDGQSAKRSDAEHIPEGRWARVTASMTVSPPLFGWLAQFGDRIAIESPADVEKSYLDHLKTILGASAARHAYAHGERSAQ